MRALRRNPSRSRRTMETILCTHSLTQTRKAGCGNKVCSILTPGYQSYGAAEVNSLYTSFSNLQCVSIFVDVKERVTFKVVIVKRNNVVRHICASNMLCWSASSLLYLCKQASPSSSWALALCLADFKAFKVKINCREDFQPALNDSLICPTLKV